jgi:hypothetical protein
MVLKLLGCLAKGVLVHGDESRGAGVNRLRQHPASSCGRAQGLSLQREYA